MVSQFVIPSKPVKIELSIFISSDDSPIILIFSLWHGSAASVTPRVRGWTKKALVINLLYYPANKIAGSALFFPKKKDFV
jgi:hypothetical protein